MAAADASANSASTKGDVDQSLGGIGTSLAATQRKIEIKRPGKDMFMASVKQIGMENLNIRLMKYTASLIAENMQKIYTPEN